MKKAILVKTVGGKFWIGGLYYARNIIYSMLNNDSIVSNYDIYVFVEKSNAKEFIDLSDEIHVKKFNIHNKTISRLMMLFFSVFHNVKYIFPFSISLALCGISGISWIPDFQHNYYPELFEKKEVERRTALYSQLARGKKKIVLSSQAAYDDFVRFYNPTNKNIKVVPFVSYIEPIINSLTNDIELAVLEKYNLTDTKYICVMNQFWQHKNHIVVLEAMKLFFQKNIKSSFKFVFTGKLEDYRCPQYIEKLKLLFEDNLIKQHSILLGFVERDEQIAIMKNAEYVIQPSLFEGWGTVVEDAKVLDKTILLSDIPVHREQMSEKCILFDPLDSQKLAALIEQENAKEHHDYIVAGIDDMKARAKEYSKGFQELLEL